jgi:hypothetical protein
MRKKGKCIFAHGPIELRVRETRRDRWGINPAVGLSSVGAGSDTSIEQQQLSLLRLSGGEDVLGAARSIEKVRVAEGSISEFEKKSSPFPSSASPSSPQYFDNNNSNNNSAGGGGYSNNSNTSTRTTYNNSQFNSPFGFSDSQQIYYAVNPLQRGVYYQTSNYYSKGT